MTDIKATVKNAVNQVAETSKQVVDNARQTASTIAERSKEALNALSQGASTAANYLEKQSEKTSEVMSDGLKTTAQTIRDHAPQEGAVKDAAFGVAQQFSNAAGYLDRQGLDGFASDISAVVRNSPLAALTIGVGLGYLIGLATRNRA